jgi:hypothetical protein
MAVWECNMGKKKTSSVASASREVTKKRTAAMINETIVSTYAARLEAALGDDRSFLPIFEALKTDPCVSQVEAVALASRFVAKTAESTPRAKALERVLKRHTSLASFKLKQRAMAGRSAA